MSSNLIHVPTLDYDEVAELTWENGQVAMHGLVPARVDAKFEWNKPTRGAETLETIVNHCKPQENMVPWHSSAAGASSATMTMDALVPSSGGCSTRVGSCSSYRSGFRDHVVAHDWSAASGSESKREYSGVKGLTSTSTGSPEDTSSGKQYSLKSTSTPDEHADSVCRPLQSVPEEKKKGKGKYSTTAKRSRAATIHNLSERRRREKINQKMKTLQKLVPNANKTDKASMLDEVIEYLKQLQGQVHMMHRMSMSPMMMSLAMQQQLQMAMMNPMGMGIGMPGVMDLNAINGSNCANISRMPVPVFHPSTFVQPMMASSWDMNTTGDRIPNHNDPMAAFLAYQSQPMTLMDSYGRMAALFQQMQNQSYYSGLKN